ncbi:MAG: glycosyltransferase family 4 protein [bacterium JZ-2024 1]
MKVTFFTERLLPGFGVDLVVYHLAMGLAERGHEANIWTILWDPQVYPEANNLWIQTVAIRRPRFYPLYELGAFLRFRYLAKSARDSDIWILTSLPFYGYAWLMKHMVRRNPHKHVPRVWIMEFGLPPAFGMPLAQRFNFAYMRWTQRRWYYPEADRMITISHFLQSDLPEDLQTEATVIYPGADHYPATPGNLRAELGILPEEVLFLYIGRIDPTSQPYKGVLNLVRMFQKAREKVQTPIRLVLAGGGPPEICQRLSRQGIIVVQDLPPEKMGALILSADVIVSASAWEGFNLPIAEGQAFGKPVLCYAVGAHPEVVREEATGFLVRSEKEFVNCIRVLADHPAVRARMGREGHTWASRYRWRFAVDKLDTLIRESGDAPV